jgi:predicted metal-binding membrane protein
MAVLAVLGLMNIAWMAVIAAVFFIEKNVRRGELLPRLIGTVFVIAGLAIVVWPSTLGGPAPL